MSAKEVVEITSKIRQDPSWLIPKLEKMLTLFDGNLYREPGKIAMRTNEGPAAVREGIEFLKKQ